ESSASFVSAPPASALPATRPPTHAAALEPRPRAGGMRFVHRNAIPLNGRPAASNARRAPRATALSAPPGNWPAPSPSTAPLRLQRGAPACALAGLDIVVQRQRKAERVEAGTEVGGRCWNADVDAHARYRRLSSHSGVIEFAQELRTR